MTKKAPIDRRASLLDGAVAYALRHGLVGLSLRPLASELGTSARMLIHHFGSREALVADILTAIEGRFAAQFAEPGSGSVTDGIRSMWRQTGSPAMAPVMRTMFEIWGKALVDPDAFPAFLIAMRDPWRDLVAEGLIEEGWSAVEARPRATLIVGAFAGLQLLRLSGARRSDVDAALQLLVELMTARRRTRK